MRTVRLVRNVLFGLTLMLFVASVEPVRADECGDFGRATGQECGGNPYPFNNCGVCGAYYCGLFADGDFTCLNICGMQAAHECSTF